MGRTGLDEARPRSSCRLAGSGACGHSRREAQTASPSRRQPCAFASCSWVPAPMGSGARSPSSGLFPGLRMRMHRPSCSIARACCCAPSPRQWPLAAADRSAAMSIQRYLGMLIAYEDRRFPKHRGVDPLARHASELADDHARPRRLGRLDAHHAGGAPPRAERGSFGLDEASPDDPRDRDRRGASKIEILDLYLRLAPYGGNIEGLRAASFAYFGKEPKRLSVGEAAFLVALAAVAGNAPARPFPASGGTCPRTRARTGARTRPHQCRGSRKRQGRAHSDRAAALPGGGGPCGAGGARGDAGRACDPACDRCALASRARDIGPPAPRGARSATLDRHSRRRQRDGRVARPCRLTRFPLGEALGLDRHGACLALAGLGAQALHLCARFRGWRSHIPRRSSTIARRVTALMRRRISILPIRAPSRRDGPCRCRSTCLRSRCSHEMGPERFIARLRSAGARIVLPQGDERRVWRSASAGSGHARGYRAALCRAGAGRGCSGSRAAARRGRRTPMRFTEAVPAWYVADILKGARRRSTVQPIASPSRRAPLTAIAMPGPAASTAEGDHRGLGRPARQWRGRQASSAASRRRPSCSMPSRGLGASSRSIPAPPGAVFARSTAALPPPLRHLAAQDELPPHGNGVAATETLKIVFPLDGSAIDLGLAGARKRGAARLKALGGAPPLTWLVNGAPVLRDELRRNTAWVPEGAGFHPLDGDGFDRRYGQRFGAARVERARLSANFRAPGGAPRFFDSCAA